MVTHSRGGRQTGVARFHATIRVPAACMLTRTFESGVAVAKKFANDFENRH
jgi:hypothetical protein